MDQKTSGEAAYAEAVEDKTPSAFFFLTFGSQI
jgi:hypothetical protein